VIVTMVFPEREAQSVVELGPKRSDKGAFG